VSRKVSKKNKQSKTKKYYSLDDEDEADEYQGGEVLHHHDDSVVLGDVVPPLRSNEHDQFSPIQYKSHATEEEAKQEISASSLDGQKPSSQLNSQQQDNEHEVMMDSSRP
jgi:hypothetical protein